MEPTAVLSVYDEGRQEALKHKWIESERAARDLGRWALEQWTRDHWPAYLRARWFEHIQGKRFWRELDQGDFGLLNRQEFREDAMLLDRIVDRLKVGKENLDVICWAQTWGLPMERVLTILEALDINSRRLSPHQVCPG